MEALMLKLQAIGALKFGSFELKKDFLVPFQVDLKSVISHPLVARELCDELWTKAQHFSFDVICGAPTLGACFATYLAWKHDVPLVIRRAEQRPLQPKIEGMYKSGQKCLVIQDLFATGNSTLDTIDDLQEEGLVVRDALSLIDLELSGRKKIKERGYCPHSVFSLSFFLETLFDKGKIPGDNFKLAKDFLEENKHSGKKHPFN